MNDLDKKISEEKAKKLAALNVNLFNKFYGVKNESGKKLEFEDHFFLYDIYDDFSPKQVVLKAAQIGFSTLAIIKSLWAVKYKGLNAIYTLPSQSDVQDFVGGKVNPIIENNDIFQKWVKEKDTVKQKRVGDSSIFYRGTWTEKAALMITSDLNIYDEEDRSKAEVIEQYESRQQHSDYGWEWHFSNPSVKGHGVSQYWKKSDQKEWFIECPECSKKQYLAFPNSISFERKEFVCKYCDAVLSDEDRRVGEWVKRYKDKEFSGYHISLLMAPWVDAEDIIKKYETKSEEYFYNFVLGLPYVSEGNTIPPEKIYQNLKSQEIPDTEGTVIGVDVGKTKHFVLGNKYGIFGVGKTNDWDDIRSLLRKYDSSIAVIDALPDLTGPRQLQDEFGESRVYLSHYTRDRKTQQLVRWGKNDEKGNVKVDRNRTIQLVADELVGERIPIYGKKPELKPYADHFDNMYRITEEDNLGRPSYEWQASNDNDHWVHATVYWRVGMDKRGMGQKGDLVMPGDTEEIPENPELSPTGKMPSRDPEDIFELNQQTKDDWREQG